VDKTNLEKFTNQIRPPAGKEEATPLWLRMLYDDIFNRYYLEYDEMANEYRRAWNTVILHRLTHMRVPSDKSEALKKMREKWNVLAAGQLANIGSIEFGQIRVAGNFAGAANVNQNAIVGFPPQIVGRPLQVFADDMRTTAAGGDGLRSDQIPVQIFVHNGKWIAKNNRGYALHCMAGVMPLRLWPGQESVDERNRLSESWDASGIRYASKNTKRLDKVPRTLPSTEMPLTNGSNDTVIADVVTVPENFIVDGRVQ